MKHVVMSAIYLILLVPAVRAQDPSPNQALAVKLVDAMEFCSMMERSFEEMKTSQIKQMNEMGNQAGSTMARDVERTFELIKEVMDCESMKVETATIYADIFTAEELQGLINFYTSDLGKSFNKKQPEMMRRSMEISMKRMQKAMPTIMQKVQQEKMEAGKPAAGE